MSLHLDGSLPRAKRVKMSHPSLSSPEPAKRMQMYSFGSSSSFGSNRGRIVMSGANIGRTSSDAKAKTLTVKNLRGPARFDPEKYYAEVWQKCSDALDKIFAQDPTPFSYEELYRLVVTACRENLALDLFRKLEARCKQHMAGVQSDLREKASQQNVLELVLDAWKTWQDQLEKITRIFFFLNRSYLLHSKSEPTLEELGVQLFRQSVFDDESLGPEILDGICSLATTDRDTIGTDTAIRQLFCDSVKLSFTLEVYTKSVEARLLSESQAFFAKWAKENSQKSTLGEYLRQSHALKDQEQRRAEALSLNESTQRELFKQINYYLFQNETELLLRDDDVAALIRNDDVQGLSLLYGVLSPLDSSKELRSHMHDYSLAQGRGIIEDREKEELMVDRLLALKKQVDDILSDSFRGDADISYGVHDAFVTFMNKTKDDKPGEMIAKYVDRILKKGTKALDANDDSLEENEQITQQLDKALELFRFLHGKAMFEGFYKKDLAKRLLSGKSASSDLEKSTVKRLTKECGTLFTQNLDQMFKDIDLGKQESESYRKHLENQAAEIAIDFNVKVISAAAWPSYPNKPAEIPPEVQRATVNFENYYKQKHAGRTLEWKHNLANCLLRARFDQGTKELTVSCFQAIVLLCFNDVAPNTSLTFAQIQEQTQIDKADLEITLLSLSRAKHRILKKQHKGTTVEVDEKFRLNAEFSDARIRISINQIQVQETKEEQKQTVERVAADRRFETQAAIVRIMKGAKNLGHQQLIIKVIDALKTRGVIQAEDINKEIENLIEKEYIERDDSGGFDYVS